MAELNVQRRHSRPWWIWLLLALVVIGILYFLLRDNSGRNRHMNNTTGATTAFIIPAPESFYS